MSPAAKTFGALVRRRSSTRTPSSTPGRPPRRSSVRGATPTPTTTRSAPSVRPSDVRTPVDAPAPSIASTPRAERQVDAVGGVDVAVDRADLGPEHALERDRPPGATIVTSAPRCFADAATSQPIQPAPMTTTRPPRHEARAAVGIADGAQAGGRRQVRAVDGQPPRVGAGGEQKLVEPDPLAVVELDLGRASGERVRPSCRVRSSMSCVVVAALLVHPDRVARRPRRAGSPSTAAGARRARTASSPISTTRPSKPSLAQGLSGLGAGEAAAHDHERLVRRSDPPIARSRNSCLVRGSSRTRPCSADVTVRAPGFCTPRSDMQRCSASSTTPTPRGARCSSSQSATCCRQPLLHLQVTREQIDDPRQLREADDPIARQVADVRDPVERQQVVLAQRMKRDRAATTSSS